MFDLAQSLHQVATRFATAVSSHHVARLLLEAGDDQSRKIQSEPQSSQKFGTLWSCYVQKYATTADTNVQSFECVGLEVVIKMVVIMHLLYRMMEHLLL